MLRKILPRLGAKEIRTIPEEDARKLSSQVQRQPIFIILEDILDTYNVGAFFRLGEAIAAKKIYLCGRTATPPDPKIKKSSVGNWKLVPWNHKKDAAEALKEIKKDHPDLLSVAIEQHESSKDYKKINYRYPIAFILGSENYGMQPKTLELVDEIAEVPMYGLNTSLNVIVAAGIVLYHAIEIGIKNQH